MSAAALKERMRADLKAAMHSKASHEVRLLRTLIAALDNAEAIPGQHDEGSTISAFGTRAFDDPSGEVPRLHLDEVAIGQLLSGEIEARLQAAADFVRHGEATEAQRLRDEADLIARYCAS